MSQGNQGNKAVPEGFLKRKNVEISLKRYGLDVLGHMALGLFASLIIGLILKTIGEQAGIAFLEETAGPMAQDMMGPAIAVAVAYALKAPPLVVFASTATGLAGAELGGPAGALIAAVIGAELGKLISKETKIDIVLTPAVTIVAGIIVATVVGPGVELFMEHLGRVIVTATELQPVPMGIIVAVVMGLALTFPISSAALAIMLNLHGLAAGAAVVGCVSQMIGFATSSFRENGWGGLISQGLGTSMLQIPNIVKNPLVLLPPTLTGAILGPLVTTVLEMENTREGAGMGTSGLVGQFGAISAMGGDAYVYSTVVAFHFILPALLALAFSEAMRRLGWIKPGDLKLPGS